MIPTFDVVVIGAGPAGIQAALVADKLGLRVLIVDEQAEPGGQIYRNVMRVSTKMSQVLGSDYIRGRQLAQSLIRSRVERYFETSVWDISPSSVITLLTNGTTRSVQARQIIAATGALERASPIPGWTLPGVLSAGAAQVAMKSDAAIPSGRIAVAGCGPLMILVANQLLASGGNVVALIDSAPAQNKREALRHLPAALRAPSYLVKGLQMMARLRGHRVPVFKTASELQVLGDERVTGIRFRSKGSSHEIDADVILLHHGVIPNHQISMLMRAKHRWNPQQRAWAVDHDLYGQTSHPKFRVAGDGLSISGARAAECTGALAALGAAHAIGVITLDQLRKDSKPWRKALTKQMAVRPFIESLFRPPDWVCAPDDHIVVCRCEVVSAGEIRHMADIGCTGPNQTKFFSRCGMGPCQGRICGSVVTQIISERLNRSPDDVGAYRIRPPLKPLVLSAIARCTDNGENSNSI